MITIATVSQRPSYCVFSMATKAIPGSDRNLGIEAQKKGPTVFAGKEKVARWEFVFHFRKLIPGHRDTLRVV